MVKVRDVLSEIKKTVNSNNVDDRLPNKFLYNMFISTCDFLIKREADNRRLYKATESFMSIDYIELEKESLNTRFGVDSCMTIYVSKKEIPELFKTNAASITQVFSIDKSTQLIQSNPYAISKISTREFNANTHYYYISNGRLYATLPVVFMYGMFVNSNEVANFNKKEKECLSVLDSNVGIPNWLVADAINIIVQKIAGVTKRIPEDESADLNSNVKQ